MMRNGRGQVGWVECGHVGKERGALPGTNNKPRSNLLTDAPGKIWRGSVIDRNGDHAAAGACEKSGDPFRGVGAPEENGIAFSDAASRQFAGELAGDVRDAPI
jgi:hypothetical protein